MGRSYEDTPIHLMNKVNGRSHICKCWTRMDMCVMSKFVAALQFLLGEFPIHHELFFTLFGKH